MSTYYVSSGSGNNSDSGTSPTTAFATLQQAASVVKPGDTVEVESGTYTAPAGQYGILVTTHSGTASAPITFEAAPGAHPIINNAGSQAGIVVDSDWTTIKGFEVEGQSKFLNANSSQGYDGAAENGIIVQANGAATPVTNDVIEDNVVHDEPLVGIRVDGADNAQIIGNTTYGNAGWSTAGGSGISLGFMGNNPSGSKAAGSYNNLIADNVSYDNQMFVNDTGSNTPVDGNGIIVDSNNSTGYTGSTLVENNVSYDNGGSGLHSVGSNNVAFLYNTAYDNNTNVPGRGQIAAFNDTGNVIENNIMVAGQNETVVNAPGQTVDYNVDQGGGINEKGAHDIVADPDFVNASAGNFQLQQGSPAIGNANPAYTASTDIADDARPAVGADIGAYEYQQEPTPASTPTPTPTPAPAPTSGDTLTVGLGEDYYQSDAQATISIDGKTLGTETVTAHQSNGTPQVFTFNGDWGTGSHTVAIEFMNDAYGGSASTDRNLYVDSLSYDGTQYSSATVAGLYTPSHSVGSMPISLYSQHDMATFSIGAQSS